ncbi:hypothetical protein [uncultured Secundilactobacillus sp.]|uniref:hypothetical protein n=1 Tax=uncultured Secundilactobacillus sp. TaxID=2813935 RepID=UPI0025852D58|nr:hypothetical protein [uncultured Secundilactobacillus sp.]
MESKRSISLLVSTGLISLGLLSGSLGSSSTARAATNSWQKDHWVTLTKNVRINKIKNVFPILTSREVGHYIAKKGYHLKLEHTGVNYPWIARSGRFNSNGKYTYAIAKGPTDGSWYRFGIH